MLLSKSKYLVGLQCPRHLWIAFNDKEKLPEFDAATQKRFDVGHDLEEYAKKLFPGGIDIPTEDFKESLELTKASLEKGKPLFEPAFKIDDLYSRGDIFVPNGDGWDVIEIKSATKVKDVNLHDVSFQKYVYEKCGLKIKNCYLMHINNEYVRDGDIDPSKLLIKEDITSQVDEYIIGISERISKMKEIISDPVLVENNIGPHCSDPYDCPLIDDCWSFLPSGHVFQLYGSNKKGFSLIEDKIYALKDIPDDFKLNDKQGIQIKCEKSGKVHVNKEAIKHFLKSLEYPFYYLDFETINPAIPLFDGSRPYQQIPFQFSLHVVNSKGSEVEHHEFLYSGSGDPRKEFASSLREVIGNKGSVVVYNQAFEISKLKELAEFLPSEKEWIYDVISRVVDLLVVFRGFAYYNPKQEGSASIKKVLPAIVGKDYSSLGIAEGMDASLTYLENFGKIDSVRKDLLEYCKLDTLAMVWIVEKLEEIVKAYKLGLNYQIKKMTEESKKIGKIKKVPLRELWRKEDRDFTKWLEENIDYLNDVLGFDINIESREENVGPFRVDLYGEDSQGNKVIVENQLEKTNHTHLGQIITYLTNLDAKTAIWISSEPVEEHKKAIDWLNETTPDDISFYLIQLEAIKIGDEPMAGPLFTIIRRPSTKIKQIGAEKKEYAQRHVIRKEFWTQFISEINKVNSMCSNVSPRADNWLGIALGMSGVSINLVISKKYVRSEVYINQGTKEENKKIFDYFLQKKDEIESDFGNELIWERMEDNVTSRIKYQLDGVDVSNKDDWNKMNEFLIDGAVRMEKAFKKHISKIIRH